MTPAITVTDFACFGLFEIGIDFPVKLDEAGIPFDTTSTLVPGVLYNGDAVGSITYLCNEEDKEKMIALYKKTYTFEPVEGHPEIGDVFHN